MAKSRRKVTSAHVETTTIPAHDIERHAHVEVIPTPRHTAIMPVCRRVGMHDRLVKSDKITTEEWQWASRYCLDLERVEGARPGRPEVEPDHAYAGQAIYDRRAIAATFIRLSNDRMTRAERDVVVSACVKAYRVCDVAIVCGIYPADDETMDDFAKRVDAKVKRRVVLAIQAGSGSKQNCKTLKIKEKISS